MCFAPKACMMLTCAGTFAHRSVMCVDVTHLESDLFL